MASQFADPGYRQEQAFRILFRLPRPQDKRDSAKLGQLQYAHLIENILAQGIARGSGDRLSLAVRS